MKLLILSLLLSFSALSQQNQPTILTYTFHSEVFGSERTISISLPTGYTESDSTTNYVVAYLFDGQFNPYFSMVSSVVDYYSQTGEAIPMIVVSIHSDNRSLEFTPKPTNPNTANGWGGNCGSAERLTSSLREEIIPYIEANYHTSPYRLAIGHSLGGTYVLQDIFKDTSIFSGVIAVSPNLNYDEEQIVYSGQDFFSTHPESRTFIYTSAGDQGSMENSFRNSLQKLDSIHSITSPEHMDWSCKLLDGDGHMSSFLPTFNYAYLAFNKHWIISEETFSEMLSHGNTSMLDQINAFYTELSIFVGAEVKPTNDDWNNYAYALAYFNRHDYAIHVLETAILAYPKDPNLLDTKGEILEQAGQYANAKKSYEQSLVILEANKTLFSEDMYTYYSESFSKNVNRMTDDYVEYKSLIYAASIAMEREEYKLAEKHFTKAFKLGIVRATHMDRLMAIGAYAQTKKKNEAFAQMELLATTFKLQGSEYFTEEPLMESLKSDPQWDKWMLVFEENQREAMGN